MNTEPNLVQRTLFAQDSVKQLHQSDFVNLESDTKINIIYKECILVLFYANNVESNNLINIWSVAAKNTVGPIFAACNLMIERKVAEAFTSLNMQNGSLHWAALKTIPFILVYQNGWPIAFYNGERSVQSIIDYSLTLACKAEYHEPANIFAGMTIADNDNLLIKGITEYGIPSNPARKDSLDYVTNENLRGYDKQDTSKQFGSTAERNDAAHVLAEDRRARVAVPITTVPVTAASTPEEVQAAEIRQAAQNVGEQAAAATEQALEIPGGVRVNPQGVPQIAVPTVQAPI